MVVRIVRLGSQRSEDEGLRIGTVRRPPRGVPKERFAVDDWYDVWLPQLAPSPALLKEGMRAESEKDWSSFARRYRREMSGADNSRLIELLARLSEGTDLSVGCYCEHEERCHRSILRELLEEHDARFA